MRVEHVVQQSASKHGSRSSSDHQFFHWHLDVFVCFIMVDFDQATLEQHESDFLFLCWTVFMDREPPIGAPATVKRNFLGAFGCSATVAAKAWMLHVDRGYDWSSPLEMKKRMMWGFLLMNLYPNERQMALACKADEKTLRKWAWFFVDEISMQEVDVIVWDNRYAGDIGNDCLVSVDCADFRCLGRKLPNGRLNKAWYSYKFKAPGLRYEIAVCILTGCIVWINGPFMPGDWVDVEIFRIGLLHMLDEGERVEADDGYGGESPQYCKVPSKATNPPSRKKLQTRVRLRHETMNKRMKNWGCLVQRFRHGIKKHSTCFRAVAVLTQLAIESGEELFDVREYNDEWDDDFVRNVLGL